MRLKRDCKRSLRKTEGGFPVAKAVYSYTVVASELVSGIIETRHSIFLLRA